MCVLVWTEAELIRGSPLINAARGLQPRVTWSQHPLWLSTWNFVRYWNSCAHPPTHPPSHIRFMLLKETPTSSTFLKDFPYRKIVNTTCEQRGGEGGSRGHVSVISFMKSIKRGRKGRLVEAGGVVYAVGSGRKRQNKGLHQESQHHLPYPHTHTPFGSHHDGFHAGSWSRIPLKSLFVLSSNETEFNLIPEATLQKTKDRHLAFSKRDPMGTFILGDRGVPFNRKWHLPADLTWQVREFSSHGSRVRRCWLLTVLSVQLAFKAQANSH